AVERYVYNRPPGLPIHACQRLVTVETGVAHYNLYRAILEDSLHSELRGRIVRHVKLHRLGTATGAAELRNEFIRSSGRRMSVHNHVCTRGDQLSTNCLT